MNQTFKTEGNIKATLTRINSRGAARHDWVIEDEANACDSCLICNHYKYNHGNSKSLRGVFVHICLIEAPTFIDVTEQLKAGLNTSCQHFLRRALI